MKELNDLEKKFEEIEKDIRSTIADMRETQKHIEQIPWILATVFAIVLATATLVLVLVYLHLG